MNYELFYANLQRRPVHEIKDCMHRIIGLVRILTRDGQSQDPDLAFESVEKVIINADQVLAEVHRLQTSESLWIQQAVYSKFGPRLGNLTSAQDLAVTTAPLFTKRVVIDFLSSMNETLNDVLSNTTPEFRSSPASTVQQPFSPKSEAIEKRVNRGRQDPTPTRKRPELVPSPPTSPMTPVSTVSGKDFRPQRQFVPSRPDPQMRSERTSSKPSPRGQALRHVKLVSPYPQKIEDMHFTPSRLRQARPLRRAPSLSASIQQYYESEQHSDSDESYECSDSSASSEDSDEEEGGGESDASESVASFATLVYSALQREALCREIFGTSEVPSTAVHYAFRR